MSSYKEMGLEEVIKATSNKIVDHLVNSGHDIDYPENLVLAVLLVLNRAEQLAVDDNVAGFAIAASFVTEVAKGLRVQLPEELDDRLHARIG